VRRGPTVLRPGGAFWAAFRADPQRPCLLPCRGWVTVPVARHELSELRHIRGAPTRHLVARPSPVCVASDRDRVCRVDAGDDGVSARPVGRSPRAAGVQQRRGAAGRGVAHPDVRPGERPEHPVRHRSADDRMVRAST
jgi:hypothetical protein